MLKLLPLSERRPVDVMPFWRKAFLERVPVARTWSRKPKRNAEFMSRRCRETEGWVDVSA